MSKPLRCVARNLPILYDWAKQIRISSVLIFKTLTSNFSLKEDPIKKFMPIIILFLILIVPAASYAFGLELAVGGWKQSPQGYLSYEAVTANDELDLERDANYDDETRFTARLKIDMPLFIPNIYLMASPMEFDGTGLKTTTFKFGDDTFTANVPFYSKITLDHYDIGFYYGIPFIETVSNKTVNIDVGLNIGIYDFEIEIKQDTTSIEESEDFILINLQLRQRPEEYHIAETICTV